MRNFLHTSVEGLYDMFLANTDRNDDVAYKENRRSVIGWFC